MCARFCTSLCEIEYCRHFFSKVWALFGPPTLKLMIEAVTSRENRNRLVGLQENYRQLFKKMNQAMDG